LSNAGRDEVEQAYRRSGSRRAGVPAAAAILAGLALLAPPTGAEMDINNNGPTLDAGRFAMRITNIGVIGNAFFNRGLSYDPSFEFPKGSGQELLEHAELWIGARREDGRTTVSGGPIFELRPTLDPADVVLSRNAGDHGTRSTFDDDGDGEVDEEYLDNRDDDGDGEVDEDLRFPAQQTLSCTYVDDRPEATQYGYENGELHEALGLTIRQEAHAWTVPGFEKIAGIQFTITNHGTQRLRDVRLGVYADLDSRSRSGLDAGHLNDIIGTLNDSLTVFDGVSTVSGVWAKVCYSHYGGEFPVLHDYAGHSRGPWTALLGISHTTDPLGYVTNFAFTGAREAHAMARAPRRDTAWTYTIYSPSLPPRRGGPPNLDLDRYAALRGEYPQAPTDEPRDYAILVSCGPFARLDPGQSLMIAVAFIAGENADSLQAAAQAARTAWRGTNVNAQPDRDNSSHTYYLGDTGINGHEVCFQPPEGVEFMYDPHCPEKFTYDPAYRPPPTDLTPGTNIEVLYSPSRPCIWSDLDCNACTGVGGGDTHVPWRVVAPAPPQPLVRCIPGDGQVAVEWDNMPEILMDANIIPGAPWRFWGYRLYRLDRWARESLLPPAERWQQVASFGVDTTLGALRLADITNTAMDYDSIAYERRHYPIGRYRFVDTRAMDGFDYHYVVTSVAQRQITISGTTRTELLESPFRASFSGIVRPRMEAGHADRGGKVWVVPNPFRGRAEWERQPVPGDVFTRHVDFFGLPRARAKISIYTLAGDLVKEIHHDGSGGSGQAAWDLISRNGQDIESGVYLFTVTWPGGNQVGRFVIIR
jgi:hypothetical protein